MAKEATLVSLRQKRGNHQSIIRLVIKRLDELIEAKANRCLIEEETLRLESYLAKCQDVQEDLQLLVKDAETLQEEIESWVAFESSVMDVKAKVKEYLQRYKVSESQGAFIGRSQFAQVDAATVQRRRATVCIILGSI
uniref:Uncharacterized protein n=1 Tax=Trichuris muris TaxID=70415 RepID=A0A5S6QF79_TRIMR